MPNRLADTTSPYLLQHAHNPVDWYPWGSEALDRARTEGRPILLSIGYSACHWCHVMERESFEDPDTAALMNTHFVNVKVDREERPDVDQVYMKAVQAMTGGGGWPLTVFLTPDARPYYGGTYFPPEPRHGMPSFRQVLAAAAEAFRDRPEAVDRAAAELVDAVGRTAPAGASSDAPGPDLLNEAFSRLEARYDPAHGGFGGAPKFPQPTTLEFVLRHHVRTGEPRPLEMVVHTLRRMADGGLRDHLAGGFHRYSVDARWLVPHFEKMLYDNALLARLYLDAWKVSGAGDLRQVAESTLDYLLADLQAPDGGFYAARDADSEGEEGRFYVWRPDEVRAELGADATRFMRVYDVTDGGNFEGASILHLPHGLEAAARREEMAAADLEAWLSPRRERLREARSGRVHPARDDKVLAGWNGMAIRALADAGAALGRDDYTEAAVRASRFVLDAMRADGRLLRVHAAGRAHVPAFLEDHAALGNALLSVHEATLAPEWLADVAWLCDEILERFHDADGDVLYDAPVDGERLVVRPRDPSDGATPSGNSLAAELLHRAGHLFGRERHSRAAERAVAAETSGMSRFPAGFGRLLSVADRLIAEPVEVVLVGAPDDPATRALHRTVAGRFLPGLTLTGRTPGATPPVDVPVLEGRESVDGRPTAYVCRRYVCRAPVTDVADLRAELEAPGG
ncbi:MAG: thioredoxin domain-containing protein [Longimicrobiales bacterium]